MKAVTRAIDFDVTNCGTIYILAAVSDAAIAWVEEHLPEDRMTIGPNSTVVEHRFIIDIVDGAVADGLAVHYNGVVR